MTSPGTWKFWKRYSLYRTQLDRLRDNRLIGLEPTLRISEGRLHLEAASRHRAQIRSASLELDRSLIESFRGGDVLTLLRTATADIGVSLLRGGQLIVAVGVVTATPLGDGVSARGGPVVVPGGPRQRPLRDTWVELTIAAETVHLRGGEAMALGNYRVSVVRTFQEGLPGTYESLAISLEGGCPHDAALHSAELVARSNGGLIMSDWS